MITNIQRSVLIVQDVAYTLKGAGSYRRCDLHLQFHFIDLRPSERDHWAYELGERCFNSATLGPCLDLIALLQVA